MCFLIDDDDDHNKTSNMEGTSSSSNSGSPRLQLKNQRTWLIPKKILMALLMVAVLFVFLGMVMMAIGGGIGSSVLTAIGGLMFGLGIVGIMVSIFVCLFAYFWYGRKDAEVQTGEQVWTEEYLDAPGYASIGRPSALKSANSTLNRTGNGLQGQKKVTIQPGSRPYGDTLTVGVQDVSTGAVAYHDASMSSGARSPAEKVADPRGVLGRSVSGSEVGTGGIRITPLDGSSQPFPSPGGTTYAYGGAQGYTLSRDGQVLYGPGQGQVIYGAGGSSANSSVVDAGSYTRSIPVTHIVTGDPLQQQPVQQQETVEYARVNKTIPKGGSLPVGSYLIQGQGQRFPVEEDFDYDNPVERTPMISPAASSMGGTMGRQRQGSASSNMSYHEQQMQFQRQKMKLHQQQRQQQLQQQQHMQQQQQLQQQQQQQHHNNLITHHTHEELYGPRQVSTMHRQYSSNPYHNTLPQQQQQQHYNTYSSRSSSRHDDLPPEPQPLVYPSARRPMTFEQVSSSKMSVYDNVLAGMKDIDEEE